MGEFKCPFCGSDKRMIPTGYVKPAGDKLDYEPEMVFCCDAQKKNHEYIEKNFDPDHKPDPDDVSRL